MTLSQHAAGARLGIVLVAVAVAAVVVVDRPAVADDGVQHRERILEQIQGRRRRRRWRWRA